VTEKLGSNSIDSWNLFCGDSDQLFCKRGYATARISAIMAVVIVGLYQIQP
jgi:hypothetical protein